MTWPTDLTPDRYPGTIRREISVEAAATEDARLAFTGVLRDRWFDNEGNEEDIHGWEVRMVTEPPELTIISIDVQPRFLPFPECPSAALAAQRLVGQHLAQGFRAPATAALGGLEGCTHLLTLVLAIWNHQVVSNYMITRTDDGSHAGIPMDFERIANTCSGWREGGVALHLVRDNQPLGRPVDRSRPTD